MWAARVVSSVFCLVCFPLLLFVRVKKLPGNCKAKSKVLLSSPGCYLEILSVERQSGEAGSLCPRTKPGLLTDSSLHSAAGNPSKVDAGATASYPLSLKPCCSLSTCSEQRFNPKPFSLLPPRSTETAGAHRRAATLPARSPPAGTKSRHWVARAGFNSLRIFQLWQMSQPSRGTPDCRGSKASSGGKGRPRCC